MAGCCEERLVLSSVSELCRNRLAMEEIDVPASLALGDTVWTKMSAMTTITVKEVMIRCLSLVFIL